MRGLPPLELAAAALSLWGFTRARCLPRLRVPGATGGLPALSVVVPARDEAHNLGRLLPSLRALHYPGPLEILVVDDNSTDGTAQAAQDLGASVIRPGAPPPGWLGKPFAAHRGAEAARGDWFLFTDADTWHAPESAAAAVAWAIRHGADALTLFPGWETQAPWEAAALAVAFAGLFAGLTRLDGLVNGQYFLVSRSAYFGSGGFAAVRDRMLEDLALGQRLRALRYRVALLWGEDMVRVRAGLGLRALVRAMARWAAGALETPDLRAWAPVLLAAGMANPVVNLARGRHRAGWAGWGLTALAVYPWAGRRGGPLAAGVAPLGAAILAASAVWGLTTRRVGPGIPWKGRWVR